MKIVQWSLYLLAFGVLTTVGYAAENEEAKEEIIELSNVPAAVRSTIEDQAKESEIRVIEIDRESGSPVYDIEIVKDGETKEFSVAPDGKFLGFEDENEEVVKDDDNEKEDDDDGDIDEDNDNEEDDDDEDVDEDDENDSFTSEFGAKKDEFLSTGRNPFFILEPGYQLVLKGGNERVEITVLDETKNVNGVETRVVEERETKGGQLAEVSRNFLAISKRTNSVFYFGEEVENYKEGKVVNREGEWLASEKDARMGLIMPGLALLGAKYYQEMAPGKAMDRAEIVSMNATLKTPAGEFRNCLKVEETNPLEPGEREYKLYAPGIGLIQDESLKLVRWSEMKEAGQTLSLSDLPEPVRAKIDELIAGGEIKVLEEETVDGKVVYDIEAKVNEKDVEYDLAADGTILSAEESVPYSSLPEAVQDAAESRFDSEEGLKAYKEVENGKTFYEVEGMKGGAVKELKLTDSGQIVEEE